MMTQTENLSKSEKLFDKTAYAVLVLMGIYCLIILNLEPAVLFFALGMRYFYTMLNKPFVEMPFYQRILLGLHLLLVLGTIIGLLSR
jgi:hypothetical protein